VTEEKINIILRSIWTKKGITPLSFSLTLGIIILIPASIYYFTFGDHGGGGMVGVIAGFLAVVFFIVSWIERIVVEKASIALMWIWIIELIIIAVVIWLW